MLAVVLAAALVVALSLLCPWRWQARPVPRLRIVHLNTSVIVLTKNTAAGRQRHVLRGGYGGHWTFSPLGK